MLRIHHIEVVVLEHIEKGEETTVYPSSTLIHQVLVILHGVSVGDGIRDVLEQVL